MRFFSRDKPKIKIQTSKSDGYSGWLKCPHCKELIHTNELERNRNCCSKCDYHYRLSASQRLDLIADTSSFKELFDNITTADPLNFTDSEPYVSRIAAAKKKSGIEEAAIVGTCTIEGKNTAIGIMDFSFMGGSMGSVVGERLTCIIEYATEMRLPLVIVASSGGARMQESTLSLMQMAKTSAALAKLGEARLPYISILTNPTTGGVTASFASLGDIIMAEPDALICFAGPRVIEQTIGQQLPPGAQRSEFLLKHGMIDCIVNRHDMKAKLAEFLDFFSGNEEVCDSTRVGTMKKGKMGKPKVN
jgi:acetyl-CoA carboxylase carboxyl transferase subunit beta